MPPGSRRPPEPDAHTLLPPRVRAELVQLLYRALPGAVWGTLGAIPVVLYALWTTVPRVALIGWGLALALVTLGRAAHGLPRRRARVDPDRARAALHAFAAGTLAAALGWAALPLLLFPEQSPLHQLMLAFMLAAVSSIAAISLSAVRGLAIAFIVLTLLPLALRFLFSGAAPGPLMAGMTTLHLFLLITMSVRLNRSTAENVRLRLETELRARAEHEASQRLARHIEHTPLAAIEWNRAFEITGWNPAAERMFGYGAAEVLGRDGIELLIPEQDRDAVRAAWRALLLGRGSRHGTQQILTRDGQGLLCEWYHTPLTDADGRVTGVASLGQDVTERLRIERLKNELVSVISHELRTPVTAMTGALQLLAGGVAGELSPQADNLLKIATRNGTRLLALIEDILDIRRIEEGTLPCHRVALPLPELLAQVHARFAAEAGERGVKLALLPSESRPWVMADPEALSKALGHLIANAIKFSPRGGTVETAIEATATRARITITDRGQGVPEAYRDRLFTRFSQADSSNSRSRDGSGLGLAIARGIIEQQQGTIGYRPHPVQGSIFFVDLPVATPDDRRQEKSPAS